MDLLEHRLVHSVTVEPFEGSGAHGPVFGDPVPVRCWLEQRRELVRSDTGEEVVSSSTMFCALEENIPQGSRVTFNGRTTTALTVSRFDTAGMLSEHLEVNLA